MDHEEFQKLAVRTNSPVDDIKLSETDYTIFMAALQGVIELTDILDAYKKHIFYGREIDYANIDSKLEAINAINKDSGNAVADARGQTLQPTNINIDPNVFHALLGTITEHGEIAVALANGIETGYLDLVNVCEEIGDSDWYKALFFESTGVDWDDVRGMVIKKLEIRFADKIFNSGEANQRDLESERALLESSMKGALEDYLNQHDDG